MKRTVFVLSALMSLFLASALWGIDLAVSATLDYDTAAQRWEQNAPAGSLIGSGCLLGFRVDIPLGKSIGLRTEHAVRFEQIAPGLERGVYNHNIHWDASYGVSWHLFSNKSVLDPYLALSLASAGAVWFDQAHADMRVAPVSLVVYIPVEAGLSLTLDDHLLLGASVSTVVAGFNPSPLQTYSRPQSTAAAFIGVRF